MLDVISLARLWIAARARKKEAEREYATLSELLVTKMEGHAELVVESGVVTLSPYHRAVIHDEPGAVSWLREKGLLARVAKVDMPRLTEEYQADPVAFAGVEEFIEIRPHKRLLFKETPTSVVETSGRAAKLPMTRIPTVTNQ